MRRGRRGKPRESYDARIQATATAGGLSKQLGSVLTRVRIEAVQRSFEELVSQLEVRIRDDDQAGFLFWNRTRVLGTNYLEL